MGGWNGEGEQEIEVVHMRETICSMNKEERWFAKEEEDKGHMKKYKKKKRKVLSYMKNYEFWNH